MCVAHVGLQGAPALAQVFGPERSGAAAKSSHKRFQRLRGVKSTPKPFQPKRYTVLAPAVQAAPQPKLHLPDVALGGLAKLLAIGALTIKLWNHEFLLWISLRPQVIRPSCDRSCLPNAHCCSSHAMQPCHIEDIEASHLRIRKPAIGSGRGTLTPRIVRWLAPRISLFPFIGLPARIIPVR